MLYILGFCFAFWLIKFISFIKVLDNSSEKKDS